MASTVTDQAAGLAATQAPKSAVENAPTPSAPEKSTTNKPIHSLVLDTAEVLYTIPAVVDEIRDEATRTRIHTTLVPFLTLRSPTPKSIKFVSDFARRTGDLQVLSKPDLHLIALTYELECERNGGDWRLRKEPGQKRVNGPPPARPEESAAAETAEAKTEGESATDSMTNEPTAAEPVTEGEQTEEPQTDAETLDALESKVQTLSVEEPSEQPKSSLTAETTPAEPAAEELDEESDSDSEGWITPSNLKKHQAKDNSTSAAAGMQPAQRTLQAALLTSDYAMQNVSLRINLNLIGPSMSRITHVRTWVLRCHGCFKTCKQTDKQFCPSCGQPTLTRVACSTDKDGNFRVHLKKNFQYNNRGNVYSIPKPVHGSANGKNANVQGGGKNGWGKELILSEDQKEYTKQIDAERRTKYRDAMDDDYLPDLLTGRRQGHAGSKPRVGAGRNVNAKKRR
ncbi:Nin1 binding protein [Coniochaeta pulveracea]|uniref:20S-pre-rRNA D-site endonuclease NOB1 n=1 Tax=Coniochaeta pulveracea TaxID=177199 RepID=A0A420YBC2_9PEZI|nr:Nin1 binding protein [Coniochaeta pulveracea]